MMTGTSGATRRSSVCNSWPLISTIRRSDISRSGCSCLTISRARVPELALIGRVTGFLQKLANRPNPRWVRAICELLQKTGYRPISANSGTRALEIVKQEQPDLLISDLRMVEMSGHELQTELRRVAPDVPVIMITAFGSIENAVESMKLGARDFITKPFGNQELLHVVARTLENRKLRQELKQLRGELARHYGLPNVIAADPKMRAVLEMIEQVADTPATVLLMGESGTGQDLLARAIHFSSSRREEPFIPLNCAAIPENLIGKRAIRVR